MSQSDRHPKSSKKPARRHRRWLSRRWNTARTWIASERLRQVRTYLFQGYVFFAIIAFTILALLANTMPVFQPDVLITRELQAEMPAWFGVFMQIISWPGYVIQSASIIVLVVAFLAIFGLRWEALSAFLTSIFTVALNTLIKIAVRRPRPEANLVHVFQELSSFSFPSGHVMFYTAFFGFLLFLGFTLLKRTWLRYLINIVILVFIAFIGVSRVYLGEHWASDVLGGYLLGSLVLIAAIFFYHWGKDRYFIRQPVAADTKKKPVQNEEKHEINETLNNPLLLNREQAKKEIEEDETDNANDHNSDHPES